LARSSICRTHMYLIGSGIIKQHPEVVNWPDDPEIRRIFVSNVEGYFWEHAETSYIRLASFWDRVGQLLAFAFFNIRQYEHDVFSAVMDRISANFLPMSQRVRSLQARLIIWTRQFEKGCGRARRRRKLVCFINICQWRRHCFQTQSRSG